MRMICHRSSRPSLLKPGPSALAAIFIAAGLLPAVETPPATGYLAKGPAYALRFAAPAKVPMTPLPSLPITYDPQPQFAPVAAQPIVEAIPQTTIVVTPTPSFPTNTLHGNDLVRQLLMQQPLIVGPGTGSLMKFFQSGTNQIGVMVDPAPLFQPPSSFSRPSSATYQQK
jgi:hypothetical protein